MWHNCRTSCVQNYWVCIANRLTPHGLVKVYDSMPATCNNTLTGQIAIIMKCSSQQFTVRWVDVQLQSRRDDRGLFAAAFAEALCTGQDTHVLNFSQSQKEHYLQLCTYRAQWNFKHSEIIQTKKTVYVDQGWGRPDRSTSTATVTCLGLNKERWFYVSLAKSGFIVSAYVFQMLFGHAVTVNSYSSFVGDFNYIAWSLLLRFSLHPLCYYYNNMCTKFERLIANTALFHGCNILTNQIAV